MGTRVISRAFFLFLMFAAGVTGCGRYSIRPFRSVGISATADTSSIAQESRNLRRGERGVQGVLVGSASVAANCQERDWASSKSPTRIIAGTVVNGDIDARTLAAAIEVLPRRPERIAVVDTKTLVLAKELQLRGLDAFVLCGSSVIYLRRQSATLAAAEYSGGPYVLMLAVVIWHEMAHTEGLGERQAQQREEDLWMDFTRRGLVDSALGLTYLAELRRRRN